VGTPHRLQSLTRKAMCQRREEVVDLGAAGQLGHRVVHHTLDPLARLDVAEFVDKSIDSPVDVLLGYGAQRVARGHDSILRAARDAVWFEWG
jgi:hypothetical protein